MLVGGRRVRQCRGRGGKEAEDLDQESMDSGDGRFRIIFPLPPRNIFWIQEANRFAECNRTALGIVALLICIQSIVYSESSWKHQNTR